MLLGLAAAVPRAGAADDAPPLPARGRAEHVVIVVWDGMRPDFVTEEHTPTLAKLAAGGVFFERHHAVYPTSTEVNGTVLATGVWPERSGIIANREYRPAIDPLKNVPTEVPEVVAKGDRLTGGKFVAVPTLPELVRAAGGRTAVAATKGVGLLWDRGARADGSVTVAHGHTVPESALTAVEAALGGPFPADPPKFPNVAQDLWTTRALTEVLWRDGVPALSVLWLSDPDYSQHATAPGAPVALAALRTNADANLARVLAVLEARGVRERTDVIVVSDHGFSTISESVNAEELLSRAGFRVHSQLAAAPLPKGDVFYVGLGGTMCFYVGEHDAGTRDGLVRFLQGSAFAGVIFTRGPDDVKGTFPLGKVHLDTPDAPDVMVALRWTDAKNAAGVAGTILGDHNRQAGSGTHATLSAYDLHNFDGGGRPGLPGRLPQRHAQRQPRRGAHRGRAPRAVEGGRQDGRPRARRGAGRRTRRPARGPRDPGGRRPGDRGHLGAAAGQRHRPGRHLPGTGQREELRRRFPEQP